ncbi:MAG TPA: malectin domain-containing carbohydrate-binding protein [Chthoniobacteraceae bacterium]|nr:malectin domain-containing carbohydrate-binding protein [Chthoniobacteraceae bacterium]
MGSPSVSLQGSARFDIEKHAVAGVPPAQQPLYQARLFGTFSAVITGLAPGKYSLVLGNAELGKNQPGYRVFSVKVNGRMIVPSVDLVSQFGYATKADITFTAEPINGTITVGLEPAGGTNTSSTAHVSFSGHRVQLLNDDKGTMPCMSFLRVNNSEGGQVCEIDALSYKPQDWNRLSSLGINPMSIDVLATAPPFPGTYNIKPEDTARLTPDDVVGPDGIVYPNWRDVGIPGGIPPLPVALRIFPPDTDGKIPFDAAAALQGAVNQLSGKGGGVILLGPGTYFLDRPVFIYSDNIVIRGSGKDRTRLVFRYQDLDSGPVFLWPKPNAVVNGGTWNIEVNADPANLKDLIVTVDNIPVGRLNQHSEGPEFSVRVRSRDLLKFNIAGPHALKAVATYSDGKTTSRQINVTFDGKANLQKVGLPSYSDVGALNFYGLGVSGGYYPLAEDAHRGDTSLTLRKTTGLKPGDKIEIRGPATPRWKNILRVVYPGGGAVNNYRDNQYEIQSITGNTVHLGQALRLDFPTIDGSFVFVFTPIAGCGVEDLTLDQPRNIWTNGIDFQYAWKCWMRGVAVHKAGRQPFLFNEAKFCEIQDCDFSDAWWKGGGGTAYVAWETAFDCLMDHVTSSLLRHGPNFELASSGDVVRNSTFVDSDLQFHDGWANENLVENCTIVSRKGNGSYGFGAWASGPDDWMHGPEGPRNVIYHCDISSQLAGLWMGGMNEGWIIVYNRFVVGGGPGIVAKSASFDHIIRGNVFCFPDPVPWAIFLATKDCSGIELISNQFYGASKIVEGPAVLAVDRDNQLLPYADAKRPDAPVPSILDWERRK